MSPENDGKDAGVPDEFVENTTPAERDSFDLHDELVEAFGKPQLKYEGGDYAKTSDALPKPVDDGDLADAQAPPFLRENQCCIADRSRYVTRDGRGRVLKSFEPDQVTLDPDGTYRVIIEQLDQDPVVVQPLRRRCEHYVRQLTPPSPSELMSGHVKKGWVKRYCAARRSVAGAFLELTDSHIGACTLREPFDVATSRLLDEFDDTLEGRSRNREYVDMFATASVEFLGGAPAPEPQQEKP